ncbi:carboxypeptidase regulatory-like domain-containing protein [Streptomyces sp. MI02-7b]|uniref:carboxypeptidase regulatory-like domain-containing protein n=1 Tax=Streptomyces sp. MI02-7b TaxID=462941 RepID=UPI0029C9D125|nr:carboxypeptidase regulatory-like domain-containing protein [Streptomyces sp. MI02-7b]
MLSLAVLTVLGTQASAAAQTPTGATRPVADTARDNGLSTEPSCSTPKRNEFACFALRRTDLAVASRAAEPAGYGAGDLRSAYDLPSNGGRGQTVAVVAAYDDPTAEQDLAVYRQQYGLPACTTDNGCFRKVDQRGGSDYPQPDPEWAGEISLDLDMVSAVAPSARILLVEADSADRESLGAAVDQAVALGAKFVSNSYGSYYDSYPGGGEDPAETTDTHYDHPGVAMVVASGDLNYGVPYPAASPYVTSVGGTSLARDPSAPRGWSESVWSNGNDGTGSGCSAYQAKPAFQKDTGCPRRTVADVSAVADPATGVAVYQTYGQSGWQVYGGTSAATPIIAGVYAAAGTPAADSYPNSYPYAADSGLNDVTSGSNGECDPSYLCTAGPGYDGPTGLGTPRGLGAFRGGPRGAVSGTVTDSETGEPLAGAAISGGDVVVHSDASGAYTLSLPAGTYDIDVEAFGYATVSTPEVVIADGAALTRSYALHTVPSRTITGKVTDGSGHGWPLYAKIVVDGSPGGPVWTDPTTGVYSVTLPQNRAHTLRITTSLPGYEEVARHLAAGTSAQRLDIPVPADVWSAGAPTYAPRLTGPTQEFTSTDSAPEGWSVVNAEGTQGGWAFDDPGSRPNTTGGDGGFAVVDSDHYGYPATQDSSMVSPRFDFTGVAAPELAFDTDLVPFLGQTADLDASTDDGRTWKNVRSLTDDAAGPTHLDVPLAAYAGKPSVRLRFHYTASYALWWAVDNVVIGGRELTPAPSGLITGTVTDANTGTGLASAAVTARDEPGLSTITAATPDDPNLGDGFFTLTAPLGRHALTASTPRYTERTRTVTARADTVVASSWKLAAGQLSLTTDPIEATAILGKRATHQLTVTNTGGAQATLTVAERAGSGGTDQGAPLHRVTQRLLPSSGTDGHSAQIDGRTTRTAGRAAAPAAAGPSGDAWKPVADLPTAIMDNAVDTYDGKVYSAYGYDGEDDTGDLYRLTPDTGTWTRLTSSPHPRRAPAHGFIDGKFYAAGGWGSSTGGIDPGLDIYDPVRNTWTSGAKAPKAYAGSGSTVLDGKLYTIGGCAATSCGTTDASVYDPRANRWSEIAPYPEPIAWQSCAAIGTRIYCAGGESGGAVAVSSAYVYNPATDTWSALPDMPIPLWGAACTAANGLLLISSGVTDDSQLTNQGFALDPATATWDALPNANTSTFRSGGATGFYKVGGTVDAYELSPTTTVELLPGYDRVGLSEVSWLGESTKKITLAPGQKAQLTLTLDTTALEVAQPGDFGARLALFTDTPYALPDIPVSLHVSPPRTWGNISGTILGATATGGPAPLPGATVQIDSWAGSHTLTTRPDGTFGLWLDTRDNPLTVIVAKDGYRPTVATVRLQKAVTVTHNVTLKRS